MSLLTLKRGHTSASRNIELPTSALIGGRKYSVPAYIYGKPQGLSRSRKETRSNPEPSQCSSRREKGGRRLDAITLNSHTV